MSCPHKVISARRSNLRASVEIAHLATPQVRVVGPEEAYLLLDCLLTGPSRNDMA